MQAAVARRALSSLASKIHPQLPLTPRESQQLLNLLTTSFRSHLDREYPAGPSEAPPASTTTQLVKVEQSRRLSSSYDSASEHIDSILSNPLFARKPSRRGSDSAAANALNDPFAWFLDQAAIGTADIPKAALCLDLLQRAQNKTKGRRGSISNGDRRPASVIAEWLRTSGEETSKAFLISQLPAKGAPRRSLVNRLVPLLLTEGNHAPLWRWYTYEPEEGDMLNQAQLSPFKCQLLKEMVNGARTRDEAFAIFQHAFQLAEAGKNKAYVNSLQVAGARLVDLIVADSQIPCTPELYEQFALSTHGWLFAWKPVVQAMLCLCHPTNPDPQPALKIIKNADSFLASTHSKPSRQRFFVRMCLGAAQQLIKEEKLADAQIAMQFTKEHFEDLVLIKYHSSAPHQTNRGVSEQKKTQDEKRNIALLDGFLAT
ncbi:hypothetical protein DPSP01_003040 [Paraphaeosphaeria sporulosa]|uniref:Uncharacterized protein n=1 Tax=Paraphaeosphaeria sporulosa TaxID=1460663 RepID=A0A177CKN7_9PLEO|nr:uncharacterized protein CC84DRAFT_1173656 [Paraphaeosphaeria sporulosa]OAG08104.1 hypothetical protein CC84DRAFT_1173656 [Paraphaeosphaeria sporulosa]